MRLAATLIFACLAIMRPHNASAQDQQNPAVDHLVLDNGDARILTMGSAIGRITIDRPGVIEAAMAGGNAVRLKAIGAGRVRLSLDSAGGQRIGDYEVEVGGGEAALSRRLTTEPGMENVSVSRAGDTILLSGAVPDREHHQRVDALAKAYAGKAPVADMTAVTGNQMVAVDVQFAAVSATTLKALGFNFSKLGGSIQGAITAPDTVGSISLPNRAVGAAFDVASATPLQSAFNLFLSNPAHGITGVLSALSSAGLSEMLAQPTLLVRSGEEANFLAGGEVPVPVPQGGNTNTVGIEYREYGVRLNIAPQVLSDRRIILKLTPELSELDYNNGVQMQGYLVPGIRRRSATTTVELGSGQSFVIAGLTFSNTAVNNEKLPLLGDLPVIGALFRRTQNTQERQELVIVATPRLVTPLAPGQVPPLPGVGKGKPYDPSLGDAVTGRNGMEKRLAEYGLSTR